MTQRLRRSLLPWLCLAGMALLLACALLFGRHTLSSRSAWTLAGMKQGAIQSVPFSSTAFAPASSVYGLHAQVHGTVYWRDASSSKPMLPMAWCSSVSKSAFC